MEYNNSFPILEEVQEIAPQVSEDSEKLDFRMMMLEIGDQIQGYCPIARQSASLQKLVAQFGNAYFFYNQTGDFCLLTDFLQ